MECRYSYIHSRRRFLCIQQCIVINKTKIACINCFILINVSSEEFS